LDALDVRDVDGERLHLADRAGGSAGPEHAAVAEDGEGDVAFESRAGVVDAGGSGELRESSAEVVGDARGGIDVGLREEASGRIDGCNDDGPADAPAIFLPEVNAGRIVEDGEELLGHFGQVARGGRPGG